ncbi:MAG: 5-methyltetrahydropteroyltriglutamate--homocysteine S-methyltransferase [Alphaproteobacteria bacterium]|nr:5-methyltetrahydropteroyltriglutamate--homocysteine S-methyltransferase [Alphaproteobacteria bacterium]|tara:strand:+ start:8884 stop:11253 length:2370 start_codon:yes stop_codon:yes gene_type:complete
MVYATNLGFPRIGIERELKRSVESFWHGDLHYNELEATCRILRRRHWSMQRSESLDHIPTADFSLYDHILDLTCLLGLIPERYNWDGERVTLDTYFAMARGAKRGSDNNDQGAEDTAPKTTNVTAMEMTKWFDTNYHYIVPEFEQGMVPKLSSNVLFAEFTEAKNQGFDARPVLVSPATFTFLGKARYDGFDHKAFAESLIPVYNEILQELADLGAEWVQLDDPIFSLDLCPIGRSVIEAVYSGLKRPEGLKILVTTYFDGVRDNADLFYGLPDDTVDALHIDLCRGAGQANTSANDPEAQLDEALAKIGEHKTLSLGLVDGRNIWKNDLSASMDKIEKAIAALGTERVFIAPSCSLLHTPVDLDTEVHLDQQIKSWMAFATQKVKEIALLTQGANFGRRSIASDLKASDAVQEDRRNSDRIHNEAVQERMAAITPDMQQRQSPFPQRHAAQKAALNLPAFPTTTIGSFPQTQGIRKIRSDFKKGRMPEALYKEAMQEEIRKVIAYQEEAGLDVFVHGEPERNDMVEYFGEQLSGFTFTEHGWVQSYGSRCVKPPIVYGDVSRPKPMTVEWATYAQSQTEKTMKGMLTGPITILQWSFVRDDQPRSTTATQIALAIRDEVIDLEAAGIKAIQIDEAAFREGLPLRKDDWQAYLDNAVSNFRLSSCGVQDKTQIHTHMCYSEFNDVISSIGALDADVISIETSRSQMELLQAFATYQYPNQIGPGVYDIHSPRVPATEEIIALLTKAKDVLSPDQLWVNPDCGLKTRGWDEVKPALKNMVAAAHHMRQTS